MSRFFLLSGLTASDIFPIVVGAAGGVLILIGLLGLIFISAAKKQEYAMSAGVSQM